MAEDKDKGNALLDALANPAVVNPLAAYQGAAQTANAIWQVRAHQAGQAAGEAYQQATDPVTGEVDPGKAQAIMAGMGSRASLAAQPSATTGQALKTANLGFNQQQQVGIGRALAGVLSMPDAQQTPENYKAALDFALANHSLDQSHHDNATRALAAAGNDPAALRAFGTRIFAGTLAGPEVAGFVMPKDGTATGPDGRQIGTTQRPGSQGGALSATPQPGVYLGPSPDTVFTAPPAMVPDTRPGASPGTYTPTPRSFPQPGASSPAGGSPPPVPGNGGYTPPKTAGYQPRGGGQAPDAAPPPAAGAPQPQTYLAAPQGQPATLENDQKIHFAASQAVGDQQKRAIAGESALQALKLARTGPGTATETQYAAFLEAHGFSVPDKAGLSSADYRQLLKKNLIRFAQSAGKEAGTDFQLTEKLASNANVDEMTNPANEHVLVQDMGILRRDMAMTKAMPPPSGTGDAAKHIKAFPGDTDPRAFAIDLMSSSERAALLREAAKQGPDGKIYRSLKRAHDDGHISLPPGP